MVDFHRGIAIVIYKALICALRKSTHLEKGTKYADIQLVIQNQTIKIDCENKRNSEYREREQ